MFDIWPGSVEKPPDQYRHGEVSAKVIEQSYEDTNKSCKSIFTWAPKNTVFYGCFVPWTNEIYVPYVKTWVERRLLEHEQAHARGWRHKDEEW